jgi:hypothetical protein
MEKYQDLNEKAITGWIKEGWEWGQPIDHATFLRAKAGVFSDAAHAHQSRAKRLDWTEVKAKMSLV